jgi:hypothetical protein
MFSAVSFAEFLGARIVCPYDSFGSELVELGEKHRDWKSGRQRDDNKTHRGMDFQKMEDLCCELGKESCDYFVGDCCPVNITPRQLREDFFGFTLRALVKDSSSDALFCLSAMTSNCFIWRTNEILNL